MAASAFEVHRLDVMDSTNDWLLAAAREGASDRTVVVADFQRRGRGRLDRRWEAPAGSSLLCSVLLRVAVPAAERHLASVAVGLAALRACGACAADVASLKWPNDLVVADRKLGGILAETDGTPDAGGAVALVVGLGCNLTWPGPPEVRSTSLLEATGVRVERDQLLEALLVALEPLDVLLRTTQGRRRLVEAYRARLGTLRREVRVELHDGVLEGVAEDVTDEGHLVLATRDGRREVTAGDVVHLRGPGDAQAPE